MIFHDPIYSNCYFFCLFIKNIACFLVHSSSPIWSKLCQKGHFLSVGLIIDHRLSLLQSSISIVVAFLVTKCCPSLKLRIQSIFIDTFISIPSASSLCLIVKSLNSNRGVCVLIHALKSLKVRIPHTYVPHWTEIDISI